MHKVDRQLGGVSSHPCCGNVALEHIVTPAQNNGIIQLTGVGSRYVGYYIAGILMFLGLFPLVGGVLLAIPSEIATLSEAKT
ncbi:MAG: hypothetical protein HC866_25405 [Leptolyngbyaceae cyanobacterium RU_5_1]|nr:hypothetical protein [Leptolyngbyaceae cyanobacterium RU_5_1]